MPAEVMSTVVLPETIFPNNIFHFSDEEDIYYNDGQTRTLTGPKVDPDDDFLEEVVYDAKEHSFRDLQGNLKNIPETRSLSEDGTLFIWEIGVEKLAVGVHSRPSGLHLAVVDVPGRPRLKDVKRIFDSNPANASLPYYIECKDGNFYVGF